MGVALKNLFRRLFSEGLNDVMESQILSMSAHLIKLQRYKAADSRLQTSNGRVGLEHRRNLCNEVSLCDKSAKHDVNYGTRYRKESTMSGNEWHHMLIAADSQSPSPTALGIDSGNLNVALLPQPQSTPTSSLVEYSMPERSFLQERLSECRIEFESLTTTLKNRYTSYAINRDFQDPTRTFSPIPGKKYKSGHKNKEAKKYYVGLGMPFSLDVLFGLSVSHPMTSLRLKYRINAIK